MNKLMSFFYEREKKQTLNLAHKAGLIVIDEEKFHKTILGQSRTSMIYSIILIVLAIFIILKYLKIITW